MILQILEPTMGGVLRHVAQLTEHLVSVGLPTAVVYSSCRNDEGFAEFASALSQFGIPSADMQVSNYPSHRDLLAISRVLSFCRQVRPTLIHCHSSKAGLIGRIVAMALGVPAIYSPHAYLGFRSSRSVMGWVSQAAETVLGHVGHTITCSSDEREYATRRLRLRQDRVVTIFNGVNFSRFSPPADEKVRNELRATLGVPQDRFVVASVIRLDHQKDPLTLINGFAIARQHCPAIHLLLVGQGNLADSVRQAISSHNIEESVTWLSHHAHPELIYQAADALGATPLYEGLPLVVLEALASNLPVILTDCPGHRDFKRLGLDAMELVQVESPQGFAEGLLRLHRHRPGQPNHRETCRSHFSSEQCLARHVSLYEELLAGQAS